MIDIKNLKFGYSKRTALFDDLGISLSTGNVYGLLGKNGAGKTTLLKIIAGMLFPKSGTCHVSGSNPGHRIPSVFNDLYIIPEEFSLPAVKIKKYIRANSVFYKKFSGDKMDRLLKEFDLSEDRNLATLSFGEKKKFVIAFGLSTNARILIFDEPTNGLDIPSKGQFRKIVASSLTEDRCYIFSTHQVRDLESIIDHIVIIDSGKIVFDYPVEKISGDLSFRAIQDDRKNKDIIYSEDVLGGKHAILKKTSGDPETKVELEILFNGVLSDPEEFNKILKK